MPPNMVDTAADEKAWKRAKKQAEKAGHAEDWPYVVRIFQSMTGKVAKGIDGIPANFGPNVPRLDPTAGMGDASTWIMRRQKLAKGPLGPMVDGLRKAITAMAPDYQRPSGMDAMVIIQGLRVNMEQMPGDLRHGKFMIIGYGSVAGGCMGADGEEFDCYIGPNKAAPVAYVVDQLDEKGELDEHKAMIGFDSAEDAARAYASQLGQSRMGGMVALSPQALYSFLLNIGSVGAEPFALLLAESGVPFEQVGSPMLNSIGPLASRGVQSANGSAGKPMGEG